MTAVLQVVVILEWLAIVFGAILFIAIYGSPFRYRDREMSWHLVSAAFVWLLQALSLLLAGWSLIPIAIAEGVSAGIIYWRLALLIRTRRAARKENS